MGARTFPMFHAFGPMLVNSPEPNVGSDIIIANEPVGPILEGERGPWLVASEIPTIELRDFIIAACNTHSTITAEGGRLAKARADLAELKLREAQAAAETEVEPEPSFGWYAGLALDRLSVGPLPTSDAALTAARHEHGASKTIFVVEAKATAPVTDVFALDEVERVLQWIEDANASPRGHDAALPLLRPRHVDDLAKRLNGAVRAWMAAHGISLIGAGLGEARNHFVMIPHEAESVTTRPIVAPEGVIATGQLAPGEGVKFTARGNVVLTVADGPVPAGPRRVLVDEVDMWPGEGPFGLDEPGLCADCPSTARCANQGCGSDLLDARSATQATLRPAPVSTPMGPHTSDMVTMLDDLGGQSC